MRKSVSAWHDKWSAEGPLSEFITTRDIYEARFSNDCSIASLIQSHNWKMHMEWMSKYPIS